MVDRRTPRRRVRADTSADEDEVKPVRASSRRRRPSRIKEELPEPVEESAPDGDDMQEEIIESGNAQGSDVDEPSKRNGKRKREAALPTTASTKSGVKSTEAFAFFEGLLLELFEKDDCTDFRRPVLSMWRESDVPGYREKIERPMDLGTVKRNLRNDKYIVHNKTSNEFSFSQEAFLVDVRLVFENCMEYNEPGSNLYTISANCLKDINEEVAERDTRLLRQQEKQKRENERKRRKAAEEEAAHAAITAAKAAAALARAKKDAEDAERRRQQELRRREEEVRRQMEAEKQAAVQAAVREALERQKREQQSRYSKMVNTSSVSSDEHEGAGEVTFTFVSTAGMEKKRGRKSGVVMELEAQHDELMKKRKVMVETTLELDRDKQIELTYAEKKKLCDEVAELDFVRMKAVVDIIARGINRPDIINEVDVDLDVDHIDNVVLREIQYFLKNPAATTAREALRQVEAEITDIETRLVQIRYQKTPS